MSVHKSTVRCKLSYAVLAVAVVAALFLVIFVRQLSAHMNEICEFKGRAANTVIYSAVSQCEDDIDSCDFIRVVRNENGEITSVEADTAAVNRIQSEVILNINSLFAELENMPVQVPIGTLSGITYLSGRGFNVDLMLHQVGAVKTEMKSEFSEAGVNQTRYRLYLEISVEIKAILPVCSTDITVSSEYLLGETVIVGEVPQVFAETKNG
jgi:sporulation protein YunB